MYIRIPHVETDYSAAPLVDAVGIISLSNFDHNAGTGRIELAIYPDVASAEAGKRPTVVRGYPIPSAAAPPGAGFELPPLARFKADNAATFAALVGVFYAALLLDPALEGATPLPSA